MLFRSPHRDDSRVRPFSDRSLRFYERMPRYVASPLVSLPGIAASLGLDGLCAKLEVDRFGLNSFKIMGVQWALARWREQNPGAAVSRLITASDGNHGRAVAWAARNAGLSATIYLPRHTADAVVTRIRDEGAEVVLVSGTYDESVDAAYAASLRDGEGLLFSDTSANESDRISEWIIEGYAAIFAESGPQLDAIGFVPDLVLIQIGVGGLAAAAARYFRSIDRRLELVGVESIVAASAQQSARAGERVQVDLSQPTVMSGINAGLLSAGAWPDVKHAFDWFLAIGDGWCSEALDALHAAGVPAGPTGAAGIAGLFALAKSDQPLELRGRRALAIVTDGSLAAPAPA